ncbi:RrF2 family transcriptional regulator [Xanthocytophaga flava]|uniref:RrF2 family transcriptional regulator n=1 Tax=Xanthocytophaga flava TaxID=3048013 RepID=UPI0028D76CCE|nr:Rrf2 family transcriptional regulator [Xanthocytophaga flavus]MDJ1472330.1 Rrf2 family transcriptional regulator [Xanthocytophaga flavus]
MEVKTVGIKEIAEALEVPQPFLGKIMQDLVRRDILSSVKGPNGGFYITEQTLAIPVIKVVEAVDGLGAFQKCVLGLHQCSGVQPCPLHAQVKPYRDVLFQSLSDQKIGDLKEELASGKVFVRT